MWSEWRPRRILSRPSAANAASGKLRWVKFTVIATCAGLVLVALFANFLWVSSYRALLPKWPGSSVSFSGPASGSSASSIENKKNVYSFLEESSVYLDWEEMAPAPVDRLDGAAIQIGNLFYVFAGYQNINEVHSHVDIYDLSENKWGDRFDMPQDMAHSHLGMASDGRYIYIVTGQYGPQCRGPTAKNFVLDTKTRRWSKLPPLPNPRYAPATQLWRGRLHVMGGSKEDRWQPALEHWSLAVKDGKALETEWKPELPIPRGGPHRACIVVEDRLYVIGGQEGDFKAKPGSPIFKCSRQKEVVYSDVYMLEGEAKEWKILPPMPKPDSHIEFAWALVNDSIVIVGGTTEKNPVTKRMVLVGEVFDFNLKTQKWRTLGRMPIRIKTTLVAFWDGWLYFTSGQRDKGPNDPSPKKVIGKTWRTKLDLSQ
ncbi:hypothetical protein KP509_16G078500 [Ceratopteris richardii]|uniref:Kelch repeat-containing protein n=2 Tax=Ceratopteris richardii TaxID=49495 RepID=A0A8T2T4E4_CERRI|nr:hypothetical protein KP509_16G078500 [Ceratopteris richardii]